ncbi:MAG TPA: hypothetical protein VH761_02195, partial [Ilumatobacteraceae bacterium]
YEQRTPSAASRMIDRSGDGSTVTTTIISDTGEIVHPTNGMVWRETHASVASIRADDPLSFECAEVVTVMRRRAGVQTDATARCRLTATASDWHVDAELTASEDGHVVFERAWHSDIERDHQ